MSAMTPLFFDIETIPGQRPEIRARFEAEASDDLAAIDAQLQQDLSQLAPPANIKDQDKIADWWMTKAVEKKAALMAAAEDKRTKVIEGVDEKWRKTALSGALGQVAVIGLALGDAVPISVQVEDLSPEAEALMLNRVFELVPEMCAAVGLSPMALRWVGHNSADFDARFILQRCVILGVRIPRWFMSVINARAWESERHFDTMVQWAGVKGRVSMDNLCFALGIEGKGTGMEADGIEGSKVWDFVRDGRISDVATYCEGDIERTRAMYQRIVFATEHTAL
jgi:hypothetical protein